LVEKWKQNLQGIKYFHNGNAHYAAGCYGTELVDSNDRKKMTDKKLAENNIHGSNISCCILGKKRI